MTKLNARYSGRLSHGNSPGVIHWDHTHHCVVLRSGGLLPQSATLNGDDIIAIIELAAPHLELDELEIIAACISGRIIQNALDQPSETVSKSGAKALDR